MKLFDLIIIGGGPGGYSAAVSAADGGLSVALFEADRLGGTCLCRGCIPTKYLLDKAHCLEKIQSLTEDGVFRDAGAFSFRAIMRGKNAVIDGLSSGLGLLMKAKKITVIQSEARLLSANTVCDSDGTLYQAENIIIATGSYPFSLPCEGAELCADSTDILDVNRIPSRLVIIGGGVIGLEIASAFTAFGSSVTVIDALPRLLGTELPEAADMLLDALEAKGIAFYTGCKVEKITEDESGKTVFFTDGDSDFDKNSFSLPADTVLSVIGRKPRLDGIDADALGIKLGTRGEIVTDEKMRTSLRGVYAVGDVRGGYQLAHAAYAEADIAVADILSSRSEAAKDALQCHKKPDCFSTPRCIYTLPALSSVGLTSKNAPGYTDIKCGRSFYSANGMACAEGAKTGCVFVLTGIKTGSSDRVTVGVTAVGEGAPEMTALATAAVTGEYKESDWKRLIMAHPSLSEMLKEAALSSFGGKQS